MPVDPSATVAPTARVHPEARIGPGVRIGAFCVIESAVEVGAGDTRFRELLPQIGLPK